MTKSVRMKFPDSLYICYGLLLASSSWFHLHLTGLKKVIYSNTMSEYVILLHDMIYFNNVEFQSMFISCSFKKSLWCLYGPRFFVENQFGWFMKQSNSFIIRSGSLGCSTFTFKAYSQISINTFFYINDRYHFSQIMDFVVYRWALLFWHILKFMWVLKNNIPW